jgi:Domain of unknown function (DUF1707)
MTCGRVGDPRRQGYQGYQASWGQPGIPGFSGFAADLAGWTRSSRLRVGDVERDSAVSALGEHFAAGRLTHEEFDERSTAAWSARTAGELTALFTDLPRPHVATAVPSPRQLSRRPRRPRFPLLPALALAVGVAILTEVSFFVVLLLTWVAFVWVVRPALVRRQTSDASSWGHTSGSRRAVRGTWT